MGITQQDLQDFSDFASQRLGNGGAESISELAKEWEAQRESEQTIADILESEADIAAGRVVSVDEAFAQARRNLGLPE